MIHRRCILQIHLLVVVSILSYQVTAQSYLPDLAVATSIPDKLKLLKAACDSFNNIEQYDKQKAVATYALRLVPADDLANLSLFNYHLGVSMENLTNRDSAIFYHERSLQYAEQAHIARRIRIANQRLLFLYHSAGNEQKAAHAASVLEKILDTTTNNSWKYELLSFLGNYYNERSEYEKNIQYILRSIELQKRLLQDGGGTVDTSDIGISYLNIAKAYIDLKQPEKAIEYILPARPYLVNYLSGQTYYHKNYIDALILLGNVTGALTHYDTLASIVAKGNAGAFEWNDKLSSDLVVANYYLTRNNLDSAFLYATRASAAPGKTDAYLQSQIDLVTGKVFAARKEFGKAIPLLKNAAAMTRNASLQSHAELLQTLAQCYAGVGDWQNAYAYYEKYAPLRDSLYDEASKKSIADAEAIYQNREKQQQIRTQQSQLTANRKERLWLIGGLLLSTLLVLLLFVFYRSKRRNAKVTAAKNALLAQLNADLQESNRTKAKLFSIISHDLRSPISQVYQFLKLQQLNPNRLDETQKRELNEKIQTATGSLLETMEDILLWSKTQMNEFNPAFQSVELAPLTQTCIQLLQLNIDAKALAILQQVAPGTRTTTDPAFLQTILRNLLQNAIKASPENGTIRIYTEPRASSLAICIQNEGTPFTQQQFLTAIATGDNPAALHGFGLRLIHELATRINATIQFASPAGSGTVASIVFN